MKNALLCILDMAYRNICIKLSLSKLDLVLPGEHIYTDTFISGCIQCTYKNFFLHVLQVISKMEALYQFFSTDAFQKFWNYYNSLPALVYCNVENCRYQVWEPQPSQIMGHKFNIQNCNFQKLFHLSGHFVTSPIKKFKERF